MKKLKQTAQWLLPVIYIITALGFVQAESDRTMCSLIEVTIVDTTKNYFIEKNDVLKIIEKNEKNIEQKTIQSINLYKTESLLNSNAGIKNAEVYRTIDGTLNIKIEQRKPLVRIIDKNNKSFYIDEAGLLMPLSSKYTARVPVAAGHITFPADVKQNTDITDTTKKNKQHKILFDIYKLAKYIENDIFLQALTEQIYLNEKNEPVLIPKVGDNVIELGDTENLEQKFTNLKTIYQTGFSSGGWNKYSIINLKYKSQVVCTRR